MTEAASVTNSVLTTLDIGSGIDSTKLARDLTDAVQIPQENAIQARLMDLRRQFQHTGIVKLGINSLKELSF
jgi:hypothetical protein